MTNDHFQLQGLKIIAEKTVHFKENFDHFFITQIVLLLSLNLEI